MTGPLVKSRVLIIGAGPMQVKAILEAQVLGLEVIATDRSWDAPGLGLAEHPSCVDTKDIEGHVALAKRLKPAGVFSGGDFAVTAAHVATELALPGIPVEVAERSNNKLRMKERWKRDWIPTPHLGGIPTPVGNIVRFPVVVKPADSSASRGVSLVSRAQDLLEAIELAESFSGPGRYLVEEFVVGLEQSVEMLIDESGRHRRFGIVDRHFELLGNFQIETGHTNPTALSLSEQQELYVLVERAARSLGIAWGPYKADTIWTESGPMVLEMPARLSGGWHSQKTTPLATGMNPIRTALQLCMGMPLDPAYDSHRWYQFASCQAIFPQPGIVRSIAGLEEARALPGVNSIHLSVKDGDTVGPYRNCADRVCYVIVHGKTRDELSSTMDLVHKTLKIETT